MMKLLLATNNANKLREIRAQLNLPSIEVVSPADVGVPADFDVEETGKSFEENAELKAKAFSTLTGLATVADDSGLMIDALNGAPGIHSKRWIEGSDQDRNLYLLKQLEGKSTRGAKFVTVLALYLPDTQKTHFFEGEVVGTISEAELGTSGFGYDPVFIPEGYDKTFGELGDDIKAQLSHRHRAIEKLKVFVEQWK
jgi:XTP/dITP diphosphohydrolase